MARKKVRKNSRKVVFTFSGINLFGRFDFGWFQGEDHPGSQFDLFDWFSFLFHND
jgi:hypothetical protein